MTEPHVWERGDKARCIEGGGGKALVEGEVYTVTDVSSGYLWLGSPPGGWAPFRFEPYLSAEEETMRIAYGPKVASAFADAESCATLANIMVAADQGLIKEGDPVTMPEHYARFKIEPIRFICENGLNFFQGNVVKYIVRHDAKNGIEDIEKAIRYAQMYVKFLKGDPNWWRKTA